MSWFVKSCYVCAVLAYSGEEGPIGMLPFVPRQILLHTALSLLVDGAPKVGMVRGQGTKIREVENKQCRRRRRGDVGAAHRVAQQRQLAEKGTRAEPDGRRSHIHLNFS